MTEMRTTKINKNLLNQFLRIDEDSITSFYALLQSKVQKNEYEISSHAHYRMFLFFVFIMLYDKKKVNASVIKNLDKDDRRLVSIEGTYLSLKKLEESEEKILHLFTSQEVKSEMKRFLQKDCKVYIDGEDEESVDDFIENLNNKQDTSEEKKTFLQLYKDLKLFGMNVEKTFA